MYVASIVYIPGGILGIVYSPSSSDTEPIPSSLISTFTPIIGAFVELSLINPATLPLDAFAYDIKAIIVRQTSLYESFNLLH